MNAGNRVFGDASFSAKQETARVDRLYYDLHSLPSAIYAVSEQDLGEPKGRWAETVFVQPFVLEDRIASDRIATVVVSTRWMPKRREDSVGHLLHQHLAYCSTERLVAAPTTPFSVSESIWPIISGNLITHIEALVELRQRVPQASQSVFFEASPAGPSFEWVECCDDYMLLHGLFSKLLNGSLAVPPETTADSIALAVFKKMLDLDFCKTVSQMPVYLTPSPEFVVRFSYFQISMAGAVLSRLKTDNLPEEVAATIRDTAEVLSEKCLDLASEARPGLTALQAVLTAIVLLAEANSREGLRRVEEMANKLVNRLTSPIDRRRYLRVLGDSLNQGVNIENVSVYFAKLMIYMNLIKDEPSLLRPNNDMLRRIREIIEPAKTLLES